MQISDIPLYRLHNQRISAGKVKTPGQVVAWLGAVQAQDYYGALLALGMRMQAATQKLVEQAFQKGLILRTHFLRPTWHFVRLQDFRWMLELTAPHVHAANASMYRLQELDGAAYKRCNSLGPAGHGKLSSPACALPSPFGRWVGGEGQ